MPTAQEEPYSLGVHTHTGPRYLTVEDGAGVGKKETGFELGAGSYL